VRLLRGDPTKDRLGLPSPVYADLARSVDGIIHAAATTRFDLSLAEARKANVLATDVAEDKLADLAEAFVATRRLDVRDGVAIAALADELGPVDILFNCAGFVHHGTILDVMPDDWDFSFDLNVKSMYSMIRAFLPKMLEEQESLDEWTDLDKQFVNGNVNRLYIWDGAGHEWSASRKDMMKPATIAGNASGSVIDSVRRSECAPKIAAASSISEGIEPSATDTNVNVYGML